MATYNLPRFTWKLALARAKSDDGAAETVELVESAAMHGTGKRIIQTDTKGRRELIVATLMQTVV